MASYNYTGNFVPSRLHQEIHDSGLTTVQAVNGNKENTSVNCVFPGQLTPADKTKLDGVVAAHSPAPTTPEALSTLTFEPIVYSALIRVGWCLTQKPMQTPPAWAISVLNDANAKIVAAGG